MKTRKTLVIVAAALVILAASAAVYFGVRDRNGDKPAPTLGPTASFVLTPDAGDAPLEVKFDGSQSGDPAGDIADFAWDFGDGQIAGGPVTSHKYGAPGTFTVKLTVTNKKGAASSITKSITVTEGKAVAHVPLFTEIEPADGAVVQGTEAWIRWHATAPAKGKVFWRKAGEPDYQSVDALDGDPLLARLSGLKMGEKYEYFVEQSADGTTQRSSQRTLTANAGLALEPVAQEQTVRRDYNQTVKVTLHNTSDKKVTVAAKALARFDDLPADVVGRGSVDEPVELAPGEKIDLRLAVTATDATRETYDIPIEAGGASTVARVRVAQPKLQLSFQVVKENPFTLAKTIAIRNDGSTLADLAVRAAPPNHSDVRLDPATGHAYLESGHSIRVVATPILYLEFQSLKMELECRAGAQTVRFPVEFKAPADKRLIGVRTNSGETTGGQDWSCPNKPNTCSVVPGPGGNGPASPSKAMNGTVDGKGQTRIGAPGGILTQLAFANERENALRDPNMWLRPDHQRIDLPSNFMRLMNNDQYVALADGDGEPKAKNGQSDDGKNKPAKPGDCKSGRCGLQEYMDCFSKAREYHEEFLSLEDKLMLERKLRSMHEDYLRNEGIDPAHVRHDVDLEYHQLLINRLLMREDQLVALYAALRKKCYDDCGMILPPSILADMPPDPSREDQIKHYNPDQIEAYKEMAREQADANARMEGVYGWLSTVLIGGGIYKGATTPGHTGKVHIDELAIAGLIMDMKAREAKASAEGYKDEIDDPPSPDFAQVLLPTIDPNGIPKNITEANRLGWDAVIASRWKTAYLLAWIRSYERYQGAQAANDCESMVRQATAMVRFAANGLEASRNEQRAWHEFERSLLMSLRPDLTAGIPWEKVVEHNRKVAPADGVPSSLREVMVAAGIPQDRISAFGKRALEMTPAKARDIFSNWIRKVEETVKVGDRLRKDRPHAVWPQPDDSLQLLGHLHFSSNLLEAAQTKVGAPAAGELGSILSWRQLRPGLLEALQCRANFSRAHRGAFAGIQEGDVTNSSDTAAGWHAGERVCFAWHHQNKIAFAAFDPRGEVVMEPQVMGKGRWPRVTADGKRSAVAWSRDDGFVVRVHDGKQWGEEIALPGQEAAIAFAPDDSLFAATSKGLWKLNGQTFERVQDTAYSQPALTIDNKGQPQVAWRRDGRIVVGDKAVDEGERPTLAIAADGTLHLAYLSKGSIVVRSRKAEEWTPAATISAKGAAWPTLARSAEGIRLSYIGAAEPGPEALWLVRIPEKEPVLMPSLAGNVTESALLVDFTLRNARWKYRPYDLWLSVNDVVVQTFSNTVPEGRYLVKLNPYQVFTSSGRPAPNRIAIHSWHMNAGHYATVGDYRLMVRTSWNEQYAFGASEKEVRLAAVNPRINHNRPDLTVLANGMDLSTNAPKSGPIDFPVTVANLGEAASKPALLVMLNDNGTLVQTAVPALKPGEQWSVNLRLNGRLEKVTFRVEQDQPDFDPTNDALTVHLWTAEEAALVKNPVGTVAASSVSDVGIANKAGVPLAFTVFAKDGSEVVHREAGQPGVLLPPGEYTLQTGKTKLPIVIPAPDRLPAKPDFLAPLQTPAWYSNLRVNANNANLSLWAADGRLMRVYNSRSQYDGPFGFGWTFDYSTRLEKTKDGLQIREADDYVTTYRETDRGKYAAVVGQFSSTLEMDKERVIRRIEGAGYLKTFGRYVTSEIFDAKGRLVAVRYATGEEHEVRYAGDVLKSVVDKATGKSIYDFETNKDGKITSLVDSAGRRIRYTYERKTLGAVTGPDGTATRYRYSGGLNLTEVRYPDKAQANLEYNEEKDWLVRLRAAGIDHRFEFGEDSPKHFWTMRTDQEGSVVRWDFDDGEGGELVTTVERLDGKISRLLAQMGLANSETSLETTIAPADLANQIGRLGKPALEAIQQRLLTTKNVSPERLQRALVVLQGVRVTPSGLTTLISALTSDLRNQLAEATKGRFAIIRLDDSGKETARFPLTEGAIAGALTRLDATHVVVGESESQRLQILDLATGQWSQAVGAHRRTVEERRTDLHGRRTWGTAEYMALLQIKDRTALHVLPKVKEKNAKGWTLYLADFGTSTPDFGVMTSEILVLAARRSGFPVLAINVATGEARSLAEGPVLALTTLGADVWALYPDRVVQYKAGRAQGIVIRLPNGLGTPLGFTPLGDGTILISVAQSSGGPKKVK
jgi:PKD repeat protein